jgi:hypothetical protein
MQVVNPSVSRATSPHGTAFTILVETPSGPTVANPGPLLTVGNVPAEYGAGGVLGGACAPLGGDWLAWGAGAALDGAAVGCGSVAGGRPGSGGGWPITPPGVTGDCCANTAGDDRATARAATKPLRIEAS